MMGFNRQRGFTMIELMAVLTIASIVSIMVARQFQAKAVDTQVDAMGERAVQVSEAVKYFRQNTSDWPNSVNELVSGGYLREHPDPNMPRYVDQFTLANVGGNRITVRYQTGDARYARRLAGLLPGGSRSGTEVRYQVDRPGFEASIAAVTEEFYRLDGTTPLEGNMDGGGHDASNFRNISATNNLSAGGNISASGNITSSGSMTASNDITAGNYITARRYNDSDNSSYYMNPSSTSYLNTLSVQNRVYGSSFYDINNDSYYMNPSSSSNLAGNVTTQGEFRADTFRSRSNSTYQLTPDGDSRLRNLDVSQLEASSVTAGAFYDSNDTSYFVNPTLNNRAARLKGWIEAKGIEINSSYTPGGSCSSYGRGITTDTSGQLMYCDGGVWTSLEKTRTRFMPRNKTLWSCSEWSGVNRTCASANSVTLDIPDEAFAADITGRCARNDNSAVASITVDDDGTERQFLTGQAGGGYTRAITMSTMTVKVENSKSIRFERDEWCDGTGGMLIRMTGYWINE